MPLSGNRLLAWIERADDDEFVAAFRAAAAPNRAPATQTCSTLEEAKEWVEQQVGALSVPVEWVKSPRGR
jgi:hypothetical protein